MEYLVVMEYQNENGTIVFFDKVCGFITEDDAYYHREYLLSHQYTGRKIYVVKAKEA